MHGSSTPGGEVDISNVKFSSEITSNLSRREECKKHETLVTKLPVPESVDEELPETEAVLGSPDVEEKYYHIDKLVNELVRLRIEITQTLTKRSEMMTELEKVKDRLNFLNRPAATNLMAVESFLKDTQDKYRSLLSSVKAKDEFLSLLKRQYDDTSILAAQEKTNFLASGKSSQVTPSVPPIVEIKPVVNSTFQPENLKSRDTWAAGTTLGRAGTLESNKADDEGEAKKSRRIPRNKPGNQNYYGRSKFLSVPRNVSMASRTPKLDDKEAEMRQMAEIFSDQTSLQNIQSQCPWYDDNVVRFVLASIEDFKTLLKWLDDLESEDKWNEKDMNDVLYGLGTASTFIFFNTN